MTHLGHVLVIATVSLLAAAPAQALDDVPGWQTTRWGMSEAEVKKAVAALGLQIVPLKSADVPFKAQTSMDGQPFEITFHFLDDPHGLDRVLLRSADLSRAQALPLHESLLRSLTEAHGQPTETLSRGTTASMTRWRFSSTTIALTIYTDAGTAGRHPTAVFVTYGSSLTARDDSADQKALALGLLRMLGEARSAR